VLTQLPAYIAVYQRPDHIYQFVNLPYQSRFPHRSFLGRPFHEGTPKSVELGVVALFDQVYQTGFGNLFLRSIRASAPKPRVCFLTEWGSLGELVAGNFFFRDCARPLRKYRLSLSKLSAMRVTKADLLRKPNTSLHAL
jgi:hypothetical protein